jgi:hypothetical protein
MRAESDFSRVQRKDFPMKKLSRRNPRNPEGRNGQPISLHPLTFDEAIAGFAQVKPPQHPKEKPKAKPKKGKD